MSGVKRDFNPLVPQCFCCGREGLHQQDFYLRVLTAMEKMDLLGEKILPFASKDGQLVQNPEYTQKMREYMKSPDMQGDHIYICLSMIDVAKNPQIKSHLRGNSRFAVDMTGYALVCPTCVQKYRADAPRPVEELSFEQLQNWAVVADATKPVRQAMAAQELVGTGNKG